MKVRKYDKVNMTKHSDGKVRFIQLRFRYPKFLNTENLHILSMAPVGINVLLFQLPRFIIGCLCGACVSECVCGAGSE